MAEKPKILVLGASGLLGGNFVRLRTVEKGLGLLYPPAVRDEAVFYEGGRGKESS